ncbi:APH(3') family aminoglycoside O-phosphotransferase [Novosphingobium sp.]|uniref:APH(3') family aminoglycoside O-phosphotransferase n=1 Tax=Novosphingobium sp. TaxID=1874826 RepID=UPI00261B4E13|nr:APH(3') family aminoglycoside O-phosphotransferase [Novosphingobium sp.]
MNARTPTQPSAVPDVLRDRLAGYRWRRVTTGESGAQVWRLTADRPRPTLFLKTATGPGADDLSGEADRLRWLAPHLPVPDVAAFVVEADRAWLLMTAVPGRSVAQVLHRAGPAERIAVVDAVAAFLQRLHAVPPGDCPFPAGPMVRLAQARARIDAGLVDPADFDDERAGWTAERVWSAAQAACPTRIDPVVTHGDFTPENVLWHGGRVSGCIDAGRLGRADRHQDIALFWRGLADHGADLQDRFLSAMAPPTVDRARIDFHLLLDELF